MDERSILLAQIQTLLQEVGRAEKAMGAPQIDPDLRERVRVRFDKLIQRQQQALQNIRQEVEAGQPMDICWASFRDLRQECGPLFRESLAFMEGALARSAGVDNGLCQIADAMLDDLSHRADIGWDRFTILAEGEFFADMAEIIRLRFPEVSIWNLPVAAHEFGHFVGPRLETHGPSGVSRHPFQDLLERERQKGPQYWSYLHELFADLFATYALGPAYAYTCLLLRFDPGTAYRDGRDHPSFAKRAYAILQTLERMDKDEPGRRPQYRYVIEELRDWWRQWVAAAGQPERLDQGVTLALDETLDALYSLVKDEVPVVRYEGWLRAQRLADELRPDKDTPPAVKPEDRLPDVLNAAWLCRLDHWDEGVAAIRQIGVRAGDTCRQIVRRKA